MNERLVIIPTYNEKENVENIIRCVFSLDPEFDILIIEDNSPDGTADIVKSLQKEFPRLHMLERKGKLGLGTAYIAGFNGDWNTVITTSLKWMRISLITRTT